MTVLVPQSDAPEAMPIMPGPWQFTVSTDSPSGMVDLSIWTRHTVDGLFHGGVIDVNVFLVPSVASESYMEMLIQNAFGAFAGLTVGKVSFFTIDESFAVIDEDNFIDLFMQTAAAPTIPALNVLAVGYLTGWFEGAGGFTLGAPALPLEHGTLQSGLVMMVFQMVTMDSIIVRHETGHLAGLFHTSEIDPGYGDALDDTPFCPDVEAMLDSCPDVDNLMFPYGGLGSALELSPKQIKVIQASALHRGIVEEGGAPAIPMPAGGSNAQGASAAGAAGQGSAASASPIGLGYGHGPGARRHVPASRQPWARSLPAPLAHFLAAHWERGFGLPDPFELLRRLGGDDPKLLWSVAADEQAPAHVRMRALLALGRLAPTAAPRAELIRLAERTDEGRLVRLGALRALAAGSSKDARTVAERLVHDADRVVALTAEHIRR
jgi:hypothetical protein